MLVPTNDTSFLFPVSNPCKLLLGLYSNSSLVDISFTSLFGIVLNCSVLNWLLFLVSEIFGLFSMLSKLSNPGKIFSGSELISFFSVSVGISNKFKGSDIFSSTFLSSTISSGSGFFLGLPLLFGSTGTVSSVGKGFFLGLPLLFGVGVTGTSGSSLISSVFSIF